MKLMDRCRILLSWDTFVIIPSLPRLGLLSLYCHFAVRHISLHDSVATAKRSAFSLHDSNGNSNGCVSSIGLIDLSRASSTVTTRRCRPSIQLSQGALLLLLLKRKRAELPLHVPEDVE